MIMRQIDEQSTEHLSEQQKILSASSQTILASS